MAARRLLEEEGLEAVTLRAVGAAAEVSRGAPYRHFTDKQDMLAVLAAGALRQMTEAMARARADSRRADPQGRAALLAVLTAYSDQALAHPELYRLVFGSTAAPREHPDLAAAGASAHALLVEVVTEAQAVGALPADGDSVQLAGMLWATTHGLIDLTLTGHASEAKGIGAPTRLLTEHLRLLAPR